MDVTIVYNRTFLRTQRTCLQYLQPIHEGVYGIHKIPCKMSIKENLIYSVLLVSIITSANNSTILKVIPKGGIVSLECQLISKLDTLVWNRKGHILATYSDNSLRDNDDHDFTSVEIDTDRSMSYLKKPSADIQDAGNYCCIQYQHQHMDPSNTTFQIFIQGYPKLSVNANITKPGETILASCCVDVRPPHFDATVDFTWSIGDVPGYFLALPNSTSSTASRHCSIVMVRNIDSYTDGAKLQCQTDKAAGHFASVTLNVKYKRTQYVTAVVIPCTALVLLLLACLTYKLRKSVQVQIQHPLSIRFTSDYIQRLSNSLPSRQYLPRTAKSSNTNRNLKDTRNNTEQAGACSPSVREETSTVSLSSTKVSHCCKYDEGYDVVVQSVPVTPNQYAYSHLERGFINKGEYELNQQ
ncbi:uncharacterized protein [Apostichopus japonicus]|uniref:uncharacterized protein isoform X2 n=1 Tax=Stichopus japonicus TaxID=307972 RepID=UPI003AB6877E